MFDVLIVCLSIFDFNLFLLLDREVINLSNTCKLINDIRFCRAYGNNYAFHFISNQAFSPDNKPLFKFRVFHNNKNSLNNYIETNNLSNHHSRYLRIISDLKFPTDYYNKIYFNHMIGSDFYWEKTLSNNLLNNNESNLLNDLECSRSSIKNVKISIISTTVLIGLTILYGAFLY
jgi:hypothetical protein